MISNPRVPATQRQGPLNRGGFKRGGFPMWTCPSFFVLFCPWDFPDFSGIFPICSGTVRGFSRFVLFLHLGLLRAPTRNSPERVRDTIWTFPEKSGKHPGLETPRFSFSQPTDPYCAILRYYRCDTPYRTILLSAIPAIPQQGAIPPIGAFFLHRHISAIPHFATYRAILVRYPRKTSTKTFCDTIAERIALPATQRTPP